MRTGPNVGHQQDRHVRLGVTMRGYQEDVRKDFPLSSKTGQEFFSSQYMNTDLQVLSSPSLRGRFQKDWAVQDDWVLYVPLSLKPSL